MLSIKNQKMGRNKEVGKLNYGAEQSKARDHVSEEIFCLLFTQSQKTRIKIKHLTFFCALSIIISFDRLVMLWFNT